jgi:hypothetical protein
MKNNLRNLAARDVDQLAAIIKSRLRNIHYRPTPGCRRAYGSYWHRATDRWGSRRIDTAVVDRYRGSCRDRTYLANRRS